jgi:hypothetical protein
LTRPRIAHRRCRKDGNPRPFSPAASHRVLVEHGPLAGTGAIVIELKNRYRRVLSISLLQRSVAAEVEREWIRPVGEARKAAYA